MQGLNKKEQDFLNPSAELQEKIKDSAQKNSFTTIIHWAEVQKLELELEQKQGQLVQILGFSRPSEKNQALSQGFYLYAKEKTCHHVHHEAKHLKIKVELSKPIASERLGEAFLGFW